MGTVEERLLSKLGALPIVLRDELLASLEINGAVPITALQITGLIDNLRTELTSAFAARPAAPSAPTFVARNVPSASGSVVVDGHEYSMWCWGGRFHPVPQGWEFPVCATSVFWDLWLDGKRDHCIQPYRFLKTFDVDKVQGSRLSRARTVVKHIIAQTHKSLEDILGLALADRDKLFADTFHELSREVFSSKPESYFLDPKTQTLCYLTIYDLLKDSQKRNRLAEQAVPV